MNHQASVNHDDDVNIQIALPGTSAFALDLLFSDITPWLVLLRKNDIFIRLTSLDKLPKIQLIIKRL